MIKGNKIQVYRKWVFPLTMVICGVFLLSTVVFAFLSGKPGKLIQSFTQKIPLIPQPSVSPSASAVIGNPNTIKFNYVQSDKDVVDHGIPDGYSDISDAKTGFKLYKKEADGKTYWIKLETRLNEDSLKPEDYIADYLVRLRVRQTVVVREQYNFRSFVADRLGYKNFDSTIATDQFFVAVPRYYDRNVMPKEYHVISFFQSIPTDITDEALVSLLKSNEEETLVREFFDNYTIEHSTNITK